MAARFVFLDRTVAGDAVDQNVVDDSFRAFFIDVEDDADLLVSAFHRQFIDRRPHFRFDKALARIEIQQLIVVGAHLGRRVRSVLHDREFLSQAIVGERLFRL